MFRVQGLRLSSCGGGTNIGLFGDVVGLYKDYLRASAHKLGGPKRPKGYEEILEIMGGPLQDLIGVVFIICHFVTDQVGAFI